MSYKTTTNSDKHLVLFDAYNLLHRGYNTRDLHSAENGALKNVYLNLHFHTQHATHAALVFDTPAGKSRRQDLLRRLQDLTCEPIMSSGYKGHRGPKPDSFFAQRDAAIEIAAHMGIYSCQATRGEADDVIATYAYLAANRGWRVTVFSNDRDMYPILSYGNDMQPAINCGQIVTAETVENSWLFSPAYWADFTALKGKIDQVPGIRGIGPSTAATLIREFHTIEKMYAQLDNLWGMAFTVNQKAKLYDSLLRGIELVSASKLIAKLDHTVPGLEPLSRLRMQTRNKHAIAKILTSHNLHFLIPRTL